MKINQPTKQICFLGAGNMGEALIKGVSKSFPEYQLFFVEQSQERITYIKNNYPLVSLLELNKINNCHFLILAIKPQSLATLLPLLTKTITNPNLVIVSILAGATLKKFKTFFPNNQIIRVMPNTPALLGEGMIALSPSTDCSKLSLEQTVQIFSSLGRTEVVNEDLQNIVTALSGSGPAYFYHIADLLATECQSYGLSYAQALTMSAQTMLGAAKMLLASNEPASSLITKVCSPGGTTEAGLKQLQRPILNQILKDTIKSAKIRADELSQGG